MGVVKRVVGGTTGGTAGIALALAVKVLRSEAVQRRLQEAPDAAVRWAQARRAARSADPNRSRRFDPSERFGQRGMERRVRLLEQSAATAFSTSPAGVPAEVTEAFASVRRALDVTRPLSLMKRNRSRARIARQLDELEDTLVEAVLPTQRTTELEPPWGRPAGPPRRPDQATAGGSGERPASFQA